MEEMGGVRKSPYLTEAQGWKEASTEWLGQMGMARIAVAKRCCHVMSHFTTASLSDQHSGPIVAICWGLVVIMYTSPLHLCLTKFFLVAQYPINNALSICQIT